LVPPVDRAACRFRGGERAKRLDVVLKVDKETKALLIMWLRGYHSGKRGTG